ncbi:hypothetical protein ACI6LE_001241 [Cronobacter sakazakii]|nr:hypothetical protein [Cronobacter sakazakii]CCK07399.1 FIG00554680: hypothetical protein [Cronobacter sakazakii 696]MDQ9173727.1 hypothetical protein [Cronobacter sakazakii]MDQ9176751.1 hypothetical protein [Cronobacter sakazakii]MDQ9187378.1 hypothetical protein [Cronobacter sakazakii]MDQ9196335.1 hypothetical protein [Cronobacter sakazakii]
MLKASNVGRCLMTIFTHEAIVSFIGCVVAAIFMLWLFGRKHDK